LVIGAPQYLQTLMMFGPSLLASPRDRLCTPNRHIIRRMSEPPHPAVNTVFALREKGPAGEEDAATPTPHGQCEHWEHSRPAWTAAVEALKSGRALEQQGIAK